MANDLPPSASLSPVAPASGRTPSASGYGSGYGPSSDQRPSLLKRKNRLAPLIGTLAWGSLLGAHLIGYSISHFTPPAAGILGWRFFSWALLIGGGAAWLWTLLRWLQRQGQKAILEASEPEDDSIASLRRTLTHAKYEAGLELQGEQASDQLRQIHDRLDYLQKLLAEKFNPNELAFGRYQSAIQEVQRAVLDNLDGVANLLQALAGSETALADERLRKLQSLAYASLSDGEQVELTALRERQRLRAQTLARVADFLGRNETALTELDRMGGELSRLHSRDSRTHADWDVLLTDLRALAARTQQYATNATKEKP